MAIRKASKATREARASSGTNGEASFESILNGAINDLPEQKILPEGQYRFLCNSVKLDQTKGTIQLTLKPIESAAPVTGELDDYTPAFQRYAVKEAMQLGMLKRLLRDCKFKEDAPVSKAILELKGKHFTGLIVHTKDKDDQTRVYANIRTLVPAS